MTRKTTVLLIKYLFLKLNIPSNKGVYLSTLTKLRTVQDSYFCVMQKITDKLFSSAFCLPHFFLFLF